MRFTSLTSSSMGSLLTLPAFNSSNLAVARFAAKYLDRFMRTYDRSVNARTVKSGIKAYSTITSLNIEFIEPFCDRLGDLSGVRFGVCITKTK